MEDTFAPGTDVDTASERLIEAAKTSNLPQRASFNGTPLVAYPGDTVSMVRIRWATVREQAH